LVFRDVKNVDIADMARALLLDCHVFITISRRLAKEFLDLYAKELIGGESN